MRVQYWMISWRVFDVPEEREVHEIPSDEVIMVPESPTITKLLLKMSSLRRGFDTPDVLEIHDIPSDEVRMVPELPTATYILFP